MSTEPERKNDPSPSPLRAGGKKLLRSLAHNGGWKLLALLIAVGLWGGLILQDPTLTRERTLEDVAVSVTNADTLLRSGLIVVGGLEETVTVRLKVEVPQRYYSTVTGANYNVRVDLSRIKESGAQTVPVLTTSSSAYGTVTDISVAEIPVVVEEYRARTRIPVRLEIIGDVPAGFYGSTPTVDPALVMISGPRSLVDRVARCVAVYDQSALAPVAGAERTSVSFTLVDSAGEPVESDLITVSLESLLLDSVVVEQTLSPMREIELSSLALLTGEPAAGYEVKSMVVTPASVTVAGSQEAIEQLDAVYVSRAADITGVTESAVYTLTLRRPSGVTYLSQDSVTLAVEVGEIQTSRLFENLRVQTQGLDENLSVKLSSTRSGVTVTGASNWLDSLKSSRVTLSVNLLGLGVGEYTVPVACVIEDAPGEYTYVTPALTATITAP